MFHYDRSLCYEDHYVPLKPDHCVMKTRSLCQTSMLRRPDHYVPLCQTTMLRKPDHYVPLCQTTMFHYARPLCSTMPDHYVKKTRPLYPIIPDHYVPLCQTIVL
ncbi:hypothetical protein CEXT_805471 [Caerostris extrusa]|uniref:Uncharacterized protein n=1 Tax=Caerostris extrusa TaxID=172846 RepID=A0AAV4RFZ7_CAEEX|nr:hypothetical protein CEXT_805471 [Caerostris extrusa]